MVCTLLWIVLQIKQIYIPGYVDLNIHVETKWKESIPHTYKTDYQIKV